MEKDQERAERIALETLKEVRDGLAEIIESLNSVVGDEPTEEEDEEESKSS